LSCRRAAVRRDRAFRRPHAGSLSFPPFSVGSPRLRATWLIHDETRIALARTPVGWRSANVCLRPIADVSVTRSTNSLVLVGLSATGPRSTSRQARTRRARILGGRCENARWSDRQSVARQSSASLRHR